ncbi:hypothetical protein D6829_00470, partial [Candidatus Pacearchaeota archaeon]
EDIVYSFFDIISHKIISVCAFKTQKDMDKLFRKIRAGYCHIIQKQSYMPIQEQVKLNLFPDGILNADSKVTYAP